MASLTVQYELWHADYSAHHEKRCHQIKRALAGNDTSWLHIIFTLFFIELAFLFRCCILVLLVFGNEVVHVALSLCEFHFIHAFTSIPMEESLAAEHSRE